MIGVIANPLEHAAVCEFFELFKTPWEFYRSGQNYEVLLCTADGSFNQNTTKLVLLYSAHQTELDTEAGIQIVSQGRHGRILLYKENQIPIYGDSITFRENGTDVLVDQGSQQPAMNLSQSGGTTVARIGYDLFREVHFLLTVGQPPANASMPTLDLHIALLRNLIVASGVQLIEIPPVPDGYQFIACLTHDVDHPLLRNHKFDHTVFGFLYRAILGSLFDVLRGRIPLHKLFANWEAALKLPFVHLGLAKDFWRESDYTKLEKGLPSSFFVIPFKNCSGRTERGQAPSRRAARYGAKEIADYLHKLITAGCEIGVHGIDAWLDSSSGHEELEQIRQITGSQNIGVRMHWLYFNEQSPMVLEKAGVDYDSTVGYNETVGYRAGTLQAYKPPGATRLLELPLHIMDTALFFPCYLDLSAIDAHTLVSTIINHAVEFGGSVNVNWHDRSIAPERLWGDSYLQLVDELKRKGAWFATAADVVSWFRKRRLAVFQCDIAETDVHYVMVASGIGEDLPNLQLRTYKTPEVYEIATIDAACQGAPVSPLLS